ncbi:MAG TPA: GGDEF domain-containing protein [Oxalicibacterium sp.]|jgi:diguanylate cyclase (GGDEF)-like protein|nr:GGDEF domain-containing protein [Oxalicibacterium sp.]
MSRQSWLRGFSPQKSGIGTESGQATFRVFNVTPFCLYLVLAWYFGWHRVPVSVVVGALGYIGYAVVWVFVVRRAMFDAPTRRTIATILDQALPALGMYLAGFLAGLVAWVPTLGAIGNGLRFGTRYAWLSAAVGGPLMSAAFYFSDEWHSIPGVAAGIVLVNVLLPLYVVVLVQKLEQEKQAFELRAAHFEEATKRDELTGLLNRAGFADVYEDLRSVGTQQEMCAVLLLDLDGFKGINDACGHDEGDRILKAVAAALMTCVRSSDQVARLGGDEFAILLRHINDEKNAESIAAKMLAAMPQPVHRNLHLGASIGICVQRAGILPYEDVLKSADRLMYEAKAAGKNQYRLRTLAVPARGLG